MEIINEMFADFICTNSMKSGVYLHHGISQFILATFQLLK